MSRPQVGYFTKEQDGKQYTMYADLDYCDCGKLVATGNQTPWLVTELGTWPGIDDLVHFNFAPNSRFILFMNPLPELYISDENEDMFVCDFCM